MQNSCLADEGSMAKVGLDISDLKTTVAPVQRLIAASRAAGIPIVFSQYEFRPDYSDGGLLVELYPALREVGGMAAGTWDAAFDSRLTVEPSDIVISKNRYSAFYGTELEQVLRERGVRTLIICGVTTEMCVESTLRDGFFHDFRIVLAADAVASVDRSPPPSHPPDRRIRLRRRNPHQRNHRRLGTGAEITSPPPAPVIPAKAGIHSPPVGASHDSPSGLFSPRRPLQNSVEGKSAALGPWEREAARGLPPLPLGEGWGEGGGRRGPRDLAEADPPSYAKVSPREKIEMRGPLTTTSGYRSPPTYTDHRRSKWSE